MRIQTSFRTELAEASAPVAPVTTVRPEAAEGRIPIVNTANANGHVTLNVFFRPFETEGWRIGPRRARHEEAFTLLHLLGVLLVMGVLLLALMPPRVRQIDREARQREAQALGVPAIASDIAAHCEVANGGAILLEAADVMGWVDAIAGLPGAQGRGPIERSADLGEAAYCADVLGFLGDCRGSV